MNWTLVICCSVAVVAAFLVHGNAAQARVGLGGACSTTSQCNSSVPNSNCTSSRCVCSSGYQPTANNRACTLKLNETCNATRVCNQTGAECTVGKCSCRYDFVVSSNGTVCLQKAAMLGAYCTESTQCVAINYAVCTFSSCQCKAGYIQTSSTRCDIQGSGQKCTTSKDCTNNFECMNGYCICNGVSSTGYCRTYVWGLGKKCDDKTQVCWQDDGGDKLSCKNNKCTCNKGYVQNKEKTKCISGASSLLASTALLLFAFVASHKVT